MAVKFIDNQTKTTQISQYNLTLQKRENSEISGFTPLAYVPHLPCLPISGTAEVHILQSGVDIIFSTNKAISSGVFEAPSLIHLVDMFQKPPV